MTIYNYDLINDFANGINQTCLHNIIVEYGFSKTLLGIHITYDTNEVDIEFNGSITSEEETTLETLIDEHDPDELVCQQFNVNVDNTLCNLCDVDTTGLIDNYILIYDTTKQKWVTGPCCSSSDDGNLELVYQIEDEDCTSTSSTSWQEKLELQVLSLPEGTYKLEWSYEWAHSHSSYVFSGRLQINNTTTIMQHEEKPRTSGNFNSYSYPIAGFKILDLTAGDYEFDLDFRTNKSNKSAYIRRARMALWRIN